MSRDLQQQRDNNSETQSAADVDVDAEHKPEVSRRSSNASLRVQMKANATPQDPATVHAAAEAGVRGGGQQLPHLSRIQAAFGNHDLSGVQAHTGEQAAAANRQIGAEAYASGDHIAFAQQPDLHTAAHEAAHVVQQKQGVSIAGGVGSAGDAYEKQADAVADQVVAGQSAEHLLGAPTAGAATGQAVQRKEAPKIVDATSHEASNRKSFPAAQDTLKHLALQLRAWAADIKNFVGVNDPERGPGAACEAILGIFGKAKEELENVRETILVADRSERGLLSPEVKIVKGAFHSFSLSAQLASPFVDKNGYGKLPLDQLQTLVNTYADQIGYSSSDLDEDHSMPAGDEKSLSKTMIKEHIEGVGGALDSVKAGNDADISRLILHSRYLFETKTEHAAELKAHRSELKKFNTELAGIEAKHPDFKERLQEAHFQLAQLVK